MKPTRFQRSFILIYMLMMVVVLMGTCVMKCHGQMPMRRITNPVKAAEIVMLPLHDHQPDPYWPKDSNFIYITIPGGYQLNPDSAWTITDTIVFVESATYLIGELYQQCRTYRKERDSFETQYRLASDILRTRSWGGDVKKKNRPAFIQARTAYINNKN